MSFTSIASAVRNKLVNDPAVTAVLGTKIYPLVLPQNPVLPAAIISEVHTIPAMDDISGNAGQFRAELQLETYATTKAQAEEIDEILRLSLQGYSGAHLGVTIKGIYFLMGLPDFEDEIEDYRQISRFAIWYRRANPDHS